MVELINPEGLPKPHSYHQVAVATGSRLVFVSGQVSEDVQGNLVGAGDFALPGAHRRSRTSAARSPPPEPARPGRAGSRSTSPATARSSSR